ncbi:MAG TPA: hypothetical protein VKH42_04160 [Vicinamibacterales bacterium]|nr:hypothetical protein [Vicinamibacterales bacterium]
MEIADVRKRVREAIERARQHADRRRERNDDARRAFEKFLDSAAVPIVRQVASVLRAEGHLFTIFTPAGSVRMMSDRQSTDFVEITLDTSGYTPRVIGHTSRGGRGGNIVEYEQTVGNGDPATLTEEDVVAFLVREVEPFVEK